MFHLPQEANLIRSTFKNSKFSQCYEGSRNAQREYPQALGSPILTQRVLASKCFSDNKIIADKSNPNQAPFEQERKMKDVSSSQNMAVAIPAMRVLSPRHLKMKSPSKTLRTSNITVNRDGKRNTNTARAGNGQREEDSLINIIEDSSQQQSLQFRSSIKVYAQARKIQKNPSTAEQRNESAPRLKYKSPHQKSHISLTRVPKGKNVTAQAPKSASKVAELEKKAINDKAAMSCNNSPQLRPLKTGDFSSKYALQKRSWTR